MGRGMKGQMKEASRSGAHYAAILGEEELAAGEIALKDLESGEQERVARDALIETIHSRYEVALNEILRGEIT